MNKIRVYFDKLALHDYTTLQAFIYIIFTRHAARSRCPIYTTVHKRKHKIKQLTVDKTEQRKYIATLKRRHQRLQQKRDIQGRIV